MTDNSVLLNAARIITKHTSNPAAKAEARANLLLDSVGVYVRVDTYTRDKARQFVRLYAGEVLAHPSLTGVERKAIEAALAAMPKRGRGQPAALEPKTGRRVYLSERQSDWVVGYGDGNLSRGVRRLVDEAMLKVDGEKETPEILR